MGVEVSMRLSRCIICLAALNLAACPGGSPDGPDAGEAHDLRRRADMARDLAEPPPDLMPLPGRIGAACTADRDCLEGPSPVCWTRFLVNDPNFLEVPDGYCSSGCSNDSECGHLGR